MSVEIHHNKGPTRARVRVEVAPEVMIALQVARELRISPKHSDDGAPEGTIDRPEPVRAPVMTLTQTGPPEKSGKSPEIDAYQLNP